MAEFVDLPDNFFGAGEQAFYVDLTKGPQLKGRQFDKRIARLECDHPVTIWDFLVFDKRYFPLPPGVSVARAYHTIEASDLRGRLQGVGALVLERGRQPTRTIERGNCSATLALVLDKKRSGECFLELAEAFGPDFRLKNAA